MQVGTGTVYSDRCEADFVMSSFEEGQVWLVQKRVWRKAPMAHESLPGIDPGGKMDSANMRSTSGWYFPERPVIHLQSASSKMELPSSHKGTSGRSARFISTSTGGIASFFRGSIPRKRSSASPASFQIHISGMRHFQRMRGPASKIYDNMLAMANATMRSKCESPGCDSECG